MTSTSERASAHSLNPLQTRDYAVMYYIGKQPWIPHYVTPGVFVAPGGYERTEQQLFAAGARKATAYLWPRAWQPAIPTRKAQ